MAVPLDFCLEEKEQEVRETLNVQRLTSMNYELRTMNLKPAVSSYLPPVPPPGKIGGSYSYLIQYFTSCLNEVSVNPKWFC